VIWHDWTDMPSGVIAFVCPTQMQVWFNQFGLSDNKQLMPMVDILVDAVVSNNLCWLSLPQESELTNMIKDFVIFLATRV